MQKQHEQYQAKKMRGRPGRVGEKQPRAQGFSLLNWVISKGKSPGNEVGGEGKGMPITKFLTKVRSGILQCRFQYTI